MIVNTLRIIKKFISKKHINKDQRTFNSGALTLNEFLQKTKSDKSNFLLGLLF